MGVSLAKGQEISLGSVTSVVMGLGWDQKKARGFLDAIKGAGRVDLDSSCLLFDADRQLVEAVWFMQLKSKDGSIRHTGDNVTGAGKGDDERIIVNLASIPAAVRHLVFTINSFTGQSFEAVENAFCRLVNPDGNEEIARFDLSGGGPHTAQVMVKLSRPEDDSGGWRMQAIGESGSGRTFQDLLPLLQGLL
jgi:tellurium resistance protein TerZ